MGEEELGGGCLVVVCVEFRPEDPLLMVPADRLISRARCGRGMYLPSLGNQIKDERWCEEFLEADWTEFRAATQTEEQVGFQTEPRQEKSKSVNSVSKTKLFQTEHVLYGPAVLVHLAVPRFILLLLAAVVSKC